ncbi:MAG: SOS response-associated peptidase [Bacteroidota bacterium]
MCGRVASPPTDLIEHLLQLQSSGVYGPIKINIPPAPGTLLPIITDSKPNTLQYFGWPLVPMSSAEPKVKFFTANAKIENLHTSPVWRPLVGRRHCVIITAGFYEWKYPNPKFKKGGQAFFIKAKGQALTLMAGLWDVWTDKETGIMHPSCTIITMPANDFMADIHNTTATSHNTGPRMPAFLTRENIHTWLDRQLRPEDRLQALVPVGNEYLSAKPVINIYDEAEVLNILSA